MHEPLLPLPYRVVLRTVAAPATATLRVEPVGAPLMPVRMGQFLMAWVPGVGEVPISVSSVDPVELTVRAAGATTTSLAGTQAGGVIGVRGPFGTAWELPSSPSGMTDDGSVVVMGGGLGLAPLRPAVLAALDAGLPLVVLIGARNAQQLLFAAEIGGWRERGAEVHASVDTADRSWPGVVGPVTLLLDRAHVHWPASIALVCGPEVMMRFSARALVDRGIPAERVQVSLERNMHCGIAHCGRCQLGELLVCRDGPIVTWDRAAPLVEVRER